MCAQLEEISPKKTESPLDLVGIGHLGVPKTLTFKTSLRAKMNLNENKKSLLGLVVILQSSVYNVSRQYY